MIGVFDSGHGGLTVFRALVARFETVPFVYLGDHANVPYGNRPSDEVVELTRAGVEMLFERGAQLVLLGCNTATAVAARTLQQNWLPQSRWAGSHNVVGIVAPTVEAATQTAWSLTTPQFPQKYNTDVIAVFGTARTIKSGVYQEEIRKRCPKVTVVQQICSQLVSAIEAGAGEDELNAQVSAGVAELLAQTNGRPPHSAILGCTHFPLVEHLFRAHLPDFTRILSQPDVVADSLEDYLGRHGDYIGAPQGGASAMPMPAPQLLTTGDIDHVNTTARILWPEAPAFTKIAAKG